MRQLLEVSHTQQEEGIVYDSAPLKGMEVTSAVCLQSMVRKAYLLCCVINSGTDLDPGPALPHVICSSMQWDQQP